MPCTITRIICPGDRMRKSISRCWKVSLALVGLAGADLFSAAAWAQAPTLFQWGYGDGGEGGPDLSEPLVTDRPDFTEASSTVGLGVMQLESGYTYVYDSDDTGSFKA